MTDGIESISSACKNKYASLIIGHDPKITLITLKAGTRLRKFLTEKCTNFGTDENGSILCLSQNKSRKGICRAESVFFFCFFLTQPFR